MKHLLAPAAILTAVAIMMASATSASACFCSHLTPAERVAETELIIVGQAVSSTVMPHEPDERPQHIALIDVERYQKGSGPAALPVLFGVGSSCDYSGLYVPGDRFLLFLRTAQPEHAAPYSTSFCAGNANLNGDDQFYATSVEDYLLEVEAITGPGELPNTANLPREAFWALAILLPVAFLAGATLVTARRK